jgi:hypothetical protein
MKALTKWYSLDRNIKVCVLLGNPALPEDSGEIAKLPAQNRISGREQDPLYPQGI